MKRRAVVVASMLLTSWSVLAAGQQQDVRPAWGTPAPELSVQPLQGPAEAKTTWSALKGQAVVVEFWATWCPGCVAQIPHLNALVEKFKDKPVRFISITDEDKPAVSAFLLKRPIAGWVALDAGSVTFNRYGIYGRPQTALIDKDGVLRGLLPPHDVQESTIQELLAGTLRPKQPSDPTPRIGTEAKRPQPLVEIIVRPAMAQSDVGMSPGFVRAKGNRWEAWGMDIRSLVSRAYDAPDQRLVISENVPTVRYDLAIVMPDESMASQSAIIRHLLENALRMNVRHENKEMDVFVLRVQPDGVTFKPLVKGRSVASVARVAQTRLDRVVIDETGLTGTYDFVMAYPKSEESLRASIKALGLTLTAERRQIDVVAVDPMER